MALKAGLTGPYLPTLVRELANSLVHAYNNVISMKGLLAQNLTIGVEALYEVAKLLDIAIDHVETYIASTPGLAETWAASYNGQSLETIGADWAGVKTSYETMSAAIISILSKAADNSILTLNPDGTARTITLLEEHRTAYNSLADAIIAALE